MVFDWNGLWLAAGIPVLRSVGGWLTNATSDGKIERFEIKKLGETVLKTAIYGIMVFFCADGFGIDLEPVAAGAAGVLLDLILSAFKENKNITRR